MDLLTLGRRYYVHTPEGIEGLVGSGVGDDRPVKFPQNTVFQLTGISTLEYWRQFVRCPDPAGDIISFPEDPTPHLTLIDYPMFIVVQNGFRRRRVGDKGLSPTWSLYNAYTGNYLFLLPFGDIGVTNPRLATKKREPIDWLNWREKHRLVILG